MDRVSFKHLPSLFLYSTTTTIVTAPLCMAVAGRDKRLLAQLEVFLPSSSNPTLSFLFSWGKRSRKSFVLNIPVAVVVVVSFNSFFFFEIFWLINIIWKWINSSLKRVECCSGCVGEEQKNKSTGVGVVAVKRRSRENSLGAPAAHFRDLFWRNTQQQHFLRSPPPPPSSSFFCFVVVFFLLQTFTSVEKKPQTTTLGT